MVAIDPQVESMTVRGAHRGQAVISLETKKSSAIRELDRAMAKAVVPTVTSGDVETNDAYFNIQPGAILEWQDTKDDHLLIAIPDYCHPAGTEWINVNGPGYYKTYPGGFIAIYNYDWDGFDYISLSSVPRDCFENSADTYSITVKKDQESDRPRAIEVLSETLTRIDREQIRSNLVKQDDMPRLKLAIQKTIDHLKQQEADT